VGDRREAVRAALAAAGGGVVSGETLAGELGCSRAAVHRHVEALRREGLPVQGASGGYALDPAADVIAPTLIQERLVPPLAGPLEWHASIGSTNEAVAAAARAGAAEGLAVVAERQSAGRGRRGRRWLAAPGQALLTSVLLRPAVPPVDAATLPLLMAVAAAEAVGPSARIAWPNDILLGGRKVAGVLIETSGDHERLAWAVAGVGINVHAAPDLRDARWPPGSLADDGPAPGRGDLLVDLLGALGRRYEVWRRDGPADVLAAFGARDALLGGRVVLGTDEGEVAGLACGVDDLGRLLVEVGGVRQALAAGEVVGVGPAG